MSDGAFTLKAKGHLNGGGIIGAAIGVFVGKTVVYVAGHGAIHLIALASGPAYIPTALALEALFAPAIFQASIHGALYGEITLGTMTGPV